MTRLTRIILLVLLTGCSLAACGSDSGNTGDDAADDAGATGDGNNGGVDAAPHPDGSVPPGCDSTAGAAQCNNCLDDDHDGDIDGFDIECTGAIDDDESSFATGIPGDNQDVVNQDCFFDGNSGAGDDRCNRHICCMLGLTPQQCLAANYDNNYDPVGDCPPVEQDCIDNCDALTPPGCDCFGCCTICDDAGCVDIYVNPQIAPDCDETNIHDATACPTCTQVPNCGTECPVVIDDCILCPGEDPSTLPGTCTGQECPGSTACIGNTDCPAGEFCSSGCCIFVVD